MWPGADFSGERSKHTHAMNGNFSYCSVCEGNHDIEECPRVVALRDVPCSPSGIEAAVCADIADRQQKGIAKYGVTVAENPLQLREWLQHAYEETLDKAIYLKRAIEEVDATTIKSIPPKPEDGKYY
jgi:hypothetical protein